MRRWYAPLLFLLACLASMRPVAAQPANTTVARAYLGNQQQTGPVAAVVDAEHGLIYQAFLGSGTLLVLNSMDGSILRQWQLPTVPPVSATPRLALSPRGDRIALLVAGQGRADLAIWDSSGTSLAMVNLPYDDRPINLLMGHRRAFVLRQGFPPLAEQTAAEIAGAPAAGAPAATLSADGTTLAYLSTSGADRVGLSLLDTESLAVRATAFDAPATASFSFAVAGGRLYVASCDGVAQVELASGALTHVLDTVTIGCLSDVVVSPDGRRLLALGFNLAGTTSIVEVDVPTFEITRRFAVEGAFGRLVAAWSQGKIFVATHDVTTLEPVFSAVLDIAAGTLARLPYPVSLSDGSRGFNVADVALRQYDPRADSWRIAVFGGTVTKTVRAANGTVYAQIGGAIARIPPGATAPNAFFPGGAGMALAGDQLYSHDREYVFVSDVTLDSSRILARLPAMRAEPSIIVDPAIGKLVLPWIMTPRNALPQAGIALVDTTTGAVDIPLTRTSDRIAVALDPVAHRLYVATAQRHPDGVLPVAGELAALALDTGTTTTLDVPGIGLGNARPPVLAFDAAQGLLAISDGVTLAAHDRDGVQRWRLAVPGAVMNAAGPVWSVAGSDQLVLIDPQGGSELARETVGYDVTLLGQAGSLTYGVDARSGAIVNAQAANGRLPFRIEALVNPATSLEAAPEAIILGDSGGLVTTTVPDMATVNRGNRSVFFRVWQRADGPVAGGTARRSWTWGPVPWAVQAESYRDSPGGLRLVEYRDKTRMEVTNPGANSDGAFYVTNGLLVAEMLRGEIQVGDQAFEPHPCPADRTRFLCPRDTRVAGDLANNEGAPAYADMSGLTGVVPRAIGQRTGATFTRDPATGRFVTGTDAGLATDPATLVEYDAVTGHNIARVFWQYMNQRGPVLDGGRTVDALVVEPLFAFGRPLTEPYWIRTRVGGAGNEQFVLVQLFERRVLTYTPSNPDPFKVEMGNVGQHYYFWRYGQTRW